MSDAQSISTGESAFVRATDDLIALYRNVERHTLDLPWLSFVPFLICLWESIKFLFFTSWSFANLSSEFRHFC
jgi:hypothetical protein